MNKHLKCKELFALESVFLQKLFSSFTYPWEILPHLSEIIETIICEGLDGYERVDEHVIVAKGVLIADSARIEGSAIIGSGCELRHGALLRGSVILCDGCVIGNSSEVKNSILMDDAQAPHFNYVGDSILGKRAHLGAGAICSNLRSDGKNVCIRTQAERVETNLRKLGAILADNAEIGCGAVLCPGTVIGKRTIVYPLTLARGVYPSDSIVKDTSTVIPKA